MPVYCVSPSNILSVQRWAVAVMARGLTVGILLSWVPSRLTFWGGCNVIIWWLQQSLYTDLAGWAFFIHVSKYPLTTNHGFLLFLHLYSFFCFFPFSHSEIRSITLGQKHFLLPQQGNIFIFLIPFLQTAFIVLSLHNGIFTVLYLKILTTYIRLSILWFW